MKARDTEPTLVWDDEDRGPIAHHLPQGASQPELRHGMTLRRVLAELRQVDWGDIGGTNDLPLSDGTELYVDLAPVPFTTACLMNSQRVSRVRWDSRTGLHLVRRYKL